MVAIDATRRVASLDDGSEMAFDLFLGVPKHRVPTAVLDSGLAENGWVTVNPRTLETKYPGVYASGTSPTQERLKPEYSPKVPQRPWRAH